jgi:hypothetical protein
MTGTVDRNAEVQRLTVEWVAEMLGEPELSAQDNFIDLGGHSILALRLCQYAKEQFGEEYDLMLLFEQDLATAAAELASRVSPA